LAAVSFSPLLSRIALPNNKANVLSVIKTCGSGSGGGGGGSACRIHMSDRFFTAFSSAGGRKREDRVSLAAAGHSTKAMTINLCKRHCRFEPGLNYFNDVRRR
jgi:hypothetical protein